MFLIFTEIFRYLHGPDTIRVGWPKRAEEYPPGFGVADPPGAAQIL